MSDPLLGAVKLLGVDPIQMAHPQGEVVFGSFQQLMVVDVPQTIGVADRVIAGDGFR